MNVGTLTSAQVATLFDCMAADRQVEQFRMTQGAIQTARTLLFKFRNKKTGQCDPARKTLAEAAGLSLRTVGYSLPQLKTAGWLKWWRRRKPIRWRGRRHIIQDSSSYEFTIPRRWRRIISECKKCPGTTSIITKTAAGHLMKPKTGLPVTVKSVVEAPKGYGSNVLTPTGDPHQDATLARGYKLACEREEAKANGTWKSRWD